MAFRYELVPASLNLDIFWSQLGLELGLFSVTYTVGGWSGTSIGYPCRLSGIEQRASQLGNWGQGVVSRSLSLLALSLKFEGYEVRSGEAPRGPAAEARFLLRGTDSLLVTTSRQGYWKGTASKIWVALLGSSLEEGMWNLPVGGRRSRWAAARRKHIPGSSSQGIWRGLLVGSRAYSEGAEEPAVVIVRSVGGGDLALKELVFRKGGNSICDQLDRGSSRSCNPKQVTLKMTKFCIALRGMRKR